MNRIAFALAFAIGLLAVAWVGAGFVGSSALALAMTVAIAAAYLLGAWELHHFRAGTAALAGELSALAQPPQTLDAWLERLPRSLRQAVRLRIEGERAALPGPALTPYLVGLLVMLGMLGTFLGLILTFKGAMFAVEGSADLAAVRSALAAPIKGLGLAFGTSVAGVAASAALGLMSALSRRERLDAGRLLDAAIATVLRPFSGARQREETLEAFQLQARALPGLVERVDALVEGLERRGQELDRQLLERQENFHREASAAYAGLAGSVGGALRESLAAAAQRADESLRQAGERLLPVVESAMTGIAQESRLLHERQVEATRAQLQGLTAELGAAERQRLDAWTQSLEATLAVLRDEWDRLGARTQASHEASAATLERTAQAGAAALDRIAQSAAGALEQSTRATAAALEQSAQAASASFGQSAQAAAAVLEQSAQSIAERGNEQTGRMLAEVGALLAASEELVRARTATEAQWTRAHQERMDAMTGMLRSELGALRDDEAARGQAAVQRLEELQAAMAARTEALQAAMAGRLGELQSAAASGLTGLQSTVTGGLESMQSTVAGRLQAMQSAVAERLEALNSTASGRLSALESAAAGHLASLGTTLEAPMTRLIETASEAPRAAAEVIAELRREMSRLAERDTRSMEQQAGLVRETAALLEGLRQATQAQRAAIESLVSSAATVLDETGGRFSQVIDSQASSAAEAADRIAAGAAELASLGEAFGRGVELFGAGNQRLVEGLERVESAIARSIARSDEQLEYYVAQAREVIELSIGAQQGILEDLRRLRDPQGAAAGDAA